MKVFWRGVYLLNIAAPLACSIALHLLFRRATWLLGFPPQNLVNSPDDAIFVKDATFSRIDEFAAPLFGISWILLLFGLIPSLISLFWPVSFSSRWLRFGVFIALILVWRYWATCSEGGWYID